MAGVTEFEMPYDVVLLPGDPLIEKYFPPLDEDDRSLPWGTYVAPRHLPGKHDQKTHGHGHSSGGVDAKAIEGDLVSGKPVTVHPDDVDDLMEEFSDGPVFNLKHMQVSGAENKNCYRKNLREIPRSQMPQLPQDVEQIGAFRAKLAEHGISANLEEVDPRSLVATQNELNAQKVAKIFGSIRKSGWQDDNIMFISREGAILDGHHRWAAASAAAIAGTPVKMKTIRVDTDIDTLLAVANTVSLPKKTLARSRVDFGEEPTSPPPDENKPWIWLDGRWYFVVTDTGDGVPEELNFPVPEEETPLYEPPGTYDARHLPGKHNQKDHGHGGGKVDGVNSSSDYGMQHRPPATSYGVSMHDPEGMFPDILEHPEYYATGSEAVDRESMAAIRKAVKGGSDTPIKVYRAAPAAADTINPGDWVSPSRTYAEEHVHLAYDEGQGRVLERTALAKELHSAGDIAEWGWTPDEGRSGKS